MRFVADGLVDSWQEVFTTLSRNKLRAFLTACGVFWGIFMLIVMLGIGKGLERGTQHNLGDMTLRSVFVWPQRTSVAYQGLSPGRYVKFKNGDIDAIRAIPGVARVAPRLRLGGWRDGDSVNVGSKSGIFSVIGDHPDFRYVEPIEILNGRFLNQRDLDERRKVAVIGDDVRKILFGDVNPLGRTVQIRGVHFQVVGEILSHRGGDEGDKVKATVFVPLTTFQLAFNELEKVGWFALTADQSASAVDIEKQVRATLAARHRVHPDDAAAIGSFNAADKVAKVDGLFRGIQGFVWFVGTLTLLAGVLGVSNILLITVKERTREIGIRKALGATPWNTVSMILKESLALTATAGYLGLVASVGALELIAKAVAELPNPPLRQPEVDLGIAVLATLILTVSGVFAGVVPARQAASISPVEALRSE